MKCFKSRDSIAKTIYVLVGSILILSLALFFVPNSNQKTLDSTTVVDKVVVNSAQASNKQ